MNRPNGAGGRLRSVIFWMHLAAGVSAGLIVLIMSVTGVLLAYERQILSWVASRHAVEPPSPGAEPLPLDTILARAQAAAGERKIVSVAVRSAPSAPVAIGFDDRQSAFLDPYTAALVGDDAAVKGFFTQVMAWHRWLALGDRGRSPAGKAITGAANLLFLFLILSGMFLWWPRQLSKRAFRAVALFTRGARGKARDWNWHHVLGIWSAPVLVLIVASAAYISYDWPEKVTQRAFGESEETSRGAGRRAGAARASAEPAAARAPGPSLDSLAAAGAREVPDWKSMQMRLPRETRPLTVVVSTGAGARPDQRTQATFDTETGALRWQRYGDGSPYRRFRSWIRPIHTGEAGGLLGQTIAALVSGAAVFLVWTGLALAWRRFRGATSRRERTTSLERAA